MSAPYWIHCNLCAALLASKDTALYMLSCNHLLCKTCMQNTERGTKCPLCKAAIKFIEFKKLPGNYKEKFQPELWRTIKNPLQSVNFQNAQQNNLIKLTLDYKMKAKKAAQIHAQMKDTLMKKKAQLEKVIAQRRQMQNRLKEIYIRNQKKKASQVYREQTNYDSSASSSGVSSSSKTSTPSFFSSKASNSAKVPPLALYSTSFFSAASGSNDSAGGSTMMFGSSSSKKTQPQRRKSTSNERSQANRTPFFA